MDPLAIYIATVLSTIAPHQMHETRRIAIATDIATVVLSEPRAFDGDADGQQTALLLVSIAHYETGRSWASWVDDGRCNDEAWRTSHKLWMTEHATGKVHDCDGGNAYSMWQIHVPGDSHEAGMALVRDRKAAIRAALAIARASIQAGVGLCHYSGEAFPHCRLANARLQTARSWVTRFPYNPGVGADLLAVSPDPALHTGTGIE
jgi:hypothetical protein